MEDPGIVFAGSAWQTLLPPHTDARSAGFTSV